MDPMSAVSLASSIIAVIDFSAKVVSKSSEIYKKGSTDGHLELRLVASDLAGLCKHLQEACAGNQTANRTPEDQKLAELAQASIDVANELVQLLEKQGLDSKSNLWKSTQQAVLTIWNKERVESVQKRLHKLREETHFHIAVNNKDFLERLEAKAQQIIDEHCQFTAVLVSISLKQDRQSELATERHHEILTELRRPKWLRFPRQRPNVNTNREQDRQKNTPKPRRISEEKQRAILESLEFSTMEDRENQILEAHQRTFEWIFSETHSGATSSPDQSPQQWDSFTDWLRQGDGVYWLSGKAGSGKSTLMKFIRQDGRTYEILNEWAGDHELYVAPFYFWHNGTDLQRSLKGLLQSILFDVLTAHPELFSVVVTGTWRRMVDQTNPRRLPSPSIDQLQAGFKNLLAQRLEPLKLCFIFDGLDEYGCSEMSHTDLVALIKTSACSENVKILASSRPLLDFEEAFEGSPKLRLHQLTENDIVIFVKEELDCHEQMRRLKRNQPQNMMKLISDITSKSYGVFIWVRLVVEALLATLSRDELPSLEKLNAQLDILPEDLHDLYLHMLEQVRPEDQEEVSRIFQLVYFATRNNELILRDHVLPLPPLTPLDVSLGIEEEHGLGQSGYMPIDEVRSRCQKIERVFQSKCRGMIETCDTKDHSYTEKNVQFIHKSVTDFLENPSFRDSFIMRPRDFSPTNEMLKSQIRILRTLDVGSKAPPELPWTNERGISGNETREFLLRHSPEWFLVWKESIFQRLCWCIKLAETAEESIMVTGLDELNRILTSHWKRGRPLETCHWTLFANTHLMSRGRLVREFDLHQTFISFCVQNSVLHRYVIVQVTSHGMTILRKPGVPILLSLVESFHRSCQGLDIETIVSTIDRADIDLFEFLLQTGADPNESWSESEETTFTPWQYMLTLFRVLGCYHSLPVMISFVNHNANPNELVYEDWFPEDQPGHFYTPCRIIKICNLYYQHERQCIAEILELLRRKGGKERERYHGKLVYPHRFGLLAPRNYIEWMKSRR